MQRWERITGWKMVRARLLARGVGGFRTLHQCADDVLLSVLASKEITLSVRVCLFAKHGRVARVGDKVDQIIPAGQFTRIGRSGIQHHDHGSRAEMGRQLMGHLSDAIVGHGQESLRLYLQAPTAVEPW